MSETIAFTLNGAAAHVDVDGPRTLLGVLRGELGLTGTKYGCGEGQCGACTVVVDGEAVRACQTAIADVRGREVTTIEGLEHDGRLHALQHEFVAHGALQCGFCTPGMIMNAYALLRRQPSPTRAQVIAGMNDNLCRCAAHLRILDAVLAAAAAR